MDNDYNKLMEYQRKLLKYANQGNLEKTADTLVNMGKVHEGLGENEHAIEDYENALRLYNEAGNQKGEAFSMLHLGRVYESMDEHKRAYEYYKGAAGKFRVIGDSENHRKAELYSERLLDDMGIKNVVDSRIHRERISEHLSTPAFRYHAPILLGYLLVLIVAECSTAYINVSYGLIIYTALFFGLFLHSVLTPSKKLGKFLNSMMVLPLIRVMGFSILLPGIPQIYQLLIIGAAILVASYTIMRVHGLEADDVGLNWGTPRLQLLIGLTGLPIGFIEFWILQPAPFIPSLAPLYLFSGFLIMLVCTGFAEELLFRGIIQGGAEKVMGTVSGLLYASLLYTSLHIGWRSVYEIIFVFFIALVYGYSYQRTRSITGITVSHGLSNFILFIIMPFL